MVVPTYRDWEDARRTVESLLDCRPRPAEIVLVDDNVEDDVPTWARRLPVQFVSYAGNRGPAFARNAGARVERVRRSVDWLCFTDTGCEREPAFFGELEDASARETRPVVAVAGPVHGVVESAERTPINHYMTVEQILWPPSDRLGPQAIITANAVVSARAFDLVGGFSTEFPTAAGEDLDLGLRLRRVGWIGWATRAVVRHAFAEDLDDFERRFVRYGAGSARLARRWGFASLRAQPFRASDPATQRLADLQVAAMRRGYDAYDADVEAASTHEGVHARGAWPGAVAT